MGAEGRDHSCRAYPTRLEQVPPLSEIGLEPGQDLGAACRSVLGGHLFGETRTRRGSGRPGPPSFAQVGGELRTLGEGVTEARNRPLKLAAPASEVGGLESVDGI